MESILGMNQLRIRSNDTLTLRTVCHRIRLRLIAYYRKNRLKIQLFVIFPGISTVLQEKQFCSR